MMENGHCNGIKPVAEAISMSELPALLIEMGAKLMDPPEDLNEKLALLDRVDHLFYGLGQQPSFSVRHALLPAMEALISDKLFGNSDMFVKVSSLSCIHELIRITAPDAPFSDETMKEIFRQTVRSFEYLSLNSGRCYEKALKILECVSKVRSGLILLDLGCEQLVVRMFHLFLNSIRSDHPDDIVLHMEELMTWLIEETDEVTSEILRPLLMSITEENQVKSPPSWRLGMKVLKNCTTRVKPYILKVVGQLKRDLESFTNAVSSVWPDTPAEDNVKKETDKYASGIEQKQGDGIAEQIEQFPVVQMQGDGMAEHIEQLPVTAKMQGDGMAEHIEQLPVIAQMQGDGMAEHIEQLPVIAQTQGDGMAEHIEQLPVIAQMQGDSMAEQIEQPPVIAEGCAIPDISGSGRQTEIKTEEEVVVQRRKRGRPRKLVDGFVLSGTKNGETSSETPKTSRKRKGTALEDAAEQTPPKRRTRSKEENEFREELIGSRVKVWWPDDQAYYEGIVSSYDPTRKRHKVVYVDGDVESLRLNKERWSLVNGTSTSQEGHQEPTSSHVPVDESEKAKTSMEDNDKEIQEKKDDASSSKESIQSQLKKHIDMSGASQSQPEKHEDMSGASQSQPEKNEDMSAASSSQSV